MGESILDGRGTGDEAGVNDLNELLVANTPQITYYDNVALGNVEGSELRSVFGVSTVDEGTANEQILGDGMTTRYSFPSSPVQMTIVSTSADDDSAGTGARILLIRGNITDNVELFEAILLDGTTPVTTVNEYLRINSIVVVSAGTDGKNQGTITLKNGSDLLAQINIGINISRTAIYSVPSGSTALFATLNILTGKDGNGTVTVHGRLPSLGNLDLSSFEQETYQNQVRFGDIFRAPFAEGSDIEITGYSETGTGTSKLSTNFELLIVDQ